MGRYIVGMQNVPSPDVAGLLSNPNLRSSPFSPPQNQPEPTMPKEPDLNADYPFGRGGVYNVPVGNKGIR